VVRYDGRGFGLSDRNIKDFSLDARVSDIEAVVDALGLERFALYALSAGGPAGVAYTQRHPDKVVSLVLASTSMGMGSYSDPASKEAFRRMLDVFETSWDKTPAAIGLMLDTVFPEAKGATREVLREFLTRSTNGPDVANFFRPYLDFNVADLAQQIRVPTLVIHGEDDETIPLEAGRQSASLIPNAKFLIVPGGHSAGTGNAPESRRAILDFIDSVPFNG
jgi:pimeloyl-ACP methyl ester carboxylesterase